MEAEEARSYCPMCNAVFRTPFSRCPLDGTKLAELAGDPLVGSVLDKRYVIEECIGEGGMGRVYRAKHTRMSRHYAIKILFGDHAGDTRMRSRFAREAEAVSRLSHGNVISVVDFGETEEGLLYLVMDLADGESLAQLVHREAPLEPARAIEILARLAKGLAHAHRNGLVHRDFKCENVIMVKEEGIEVPKIVDFGICMIIEDAPAATMLTSNGMIMGTPAVMAPEQASGDKVDHRTDLFSLGIVGYQMLSGGLPFEGTPLEMARKNLYEAIPRIADRSGTLVDPGLEAIIHRLTAKNPDDRFQDATEVLDALKQLDLGASFDSWTNATPLPGSVSRPISNSGAYEHTEAVSPLHHSYGQTLAGPAQARRRKGARLAVLSVAGVAIVLLVIAIASSGGKSSRDADESGALAKGAANTQVGVAAAGATDPENAANTETPGEGLDTKADAAGAEPLHGAETPGDPETPIEPAVVPKDPPPEVKNNNKDKDHETRAERIKRLRRERAEAHARKLAAQRNRPTQKSEEVLAKARHDNTIALYESVAGALSRLERTRGPSAAERFKLKFNHISRTKLGRDQSYADSQRVALRQLLSAIKVRQKQD